MKEDALRNHAYYFFPVRKLKQNVKLHKFTKFSYSEGLFEICKAIKM
jgi:hypothetical protein